jgi:hypothetical protein
MPAPAPIFAGDRRRYGAVPALGEHSEKIRTEFKSQGETIMDKAAYDKGSMLSNQKLKKAAIYAANRQLLQSAVPS